MTRLFERRFDIRFCRRMALALSMIVAGAGAALSETQPTLVTIGRWELKGEQLSLVIPLADGLTSKQKDMINGGFTTVSQLTLRMPGPPGKEEEESAPIVYSVRCSVKFDDWDDTYDIARLDDRPRTALVKAFASYGDLCLKAELERSELIERFAFGGTMLARVDVKQTSSEEVDKIKDWLIQQQSGVMQGLFSHMLGELTLNQTLHVRVSVPPKPAALSPSVKQNSGDSRDPKRKG